MKLDAGSDRETKWWQTIPALPPLDAALPIVGHSNVGLWTWVQSRTLNLIFSSACIFEFNLRLWTQVPSSTLNSSSILIFYTLFRFNVNHVIHPIETPPRLLAGEGGGCFLKVQSLLLNSGSKSHIEMAWHFLIISFSVFRGKSKTSAYNICRGWPQEG